MAHNNTEIEIKLKISQDEYLNTKNLLEKIAVFKKISKQSDQYFTPENKNFIEPQFPFEWLSLRSRGDKTIINYKHWHPENSKNVTHCDEFETEIDSLENIKKIFEVLNIKNLVTVQKERLVFEYQDEFEIGLDQVNDLGFFIEIETIKDFGSVDIAREKLFNFAQMLNLDISNPDMRGYPYLLLEKNNLI